MELTRAGVRGDLLEDEGTEQDEEAETESKRTEMWQVWPSWGQRWISGNMENGAHLGGHSERKRNLPTPSPSARPFGSTAPCVTSVQCHPVSFQPSSSLSWTTKFLFSWYPRLVSTEPLHYLFKT